jgi:hypothetical protein
MEPIGLCALVQGVLLELDEELADNDEQRELLQELISNSKLSEGYLTLARDLDVMEPKTPDDIYKVLKIHPHPIEFSRSLLSVSLLISATA